MGERIAQAALGRFLAALDAALAAVMTSSDSAAASALDDVARLARTIDTTNARADLVASAARVAVCRFWDATLREPGDAVRPLAEALRDLGPALSWTQNPNYRRRPPDATFLDNYGYAVIAGPPDGPPALAVAPQLALGVLLLGPHAHYPLHAHPAVEIYYTLTAGGEWWRDAGPWRKEPAGVAIHHAPNVRHATRAGSSPLLALYLWCGDLATHAALV